MLHNLAINHLMNSIIGKLMPLSAKEPNPELWMIYHQMQEWKFAVEWDHPGIGTDCPADIAESILNRLETLPDRTLAQEIETMICGRVSESAAMNDA